MKKIILVLLLSISAQIFAQENIPPTKLQLDSFTVEQLQLAANEGDPDAQYALGYMYYTGKNVPQDNSKALNWIKRAAVQGQEEAMQATQILDGVKNKPVSQPVQQEMPQEISSEIPQEVPQHTPARAAPVTPYSTANGSPVEQASATPIWVADMQAIQNAPGDYYTVQLLISSNEIEINRYIEQHGLVNKAKYFPTKNNSYVLLYGIYRTRAEAQESLLKLPEVVRAGGAWVKKLEQVRVTVKA